MGNRNSPSTTGLDRGSAHGRRVDPKAAVVSRRKPPWNVLSHKPPQNF